MTEAIRLAKPLRLGLFIETAIAEDILCSLHLVRDAGRGCVAMTMTMTMTAMTMVSGVPGCGKTCALRAFARGNPLVRMITVAGGEGGAFAFAENLGMEFGVVTDGRSLPKIRREVGERIIESITMLIIDEAQNLSREALEWLRALCEEWVIGLALAGDTDLLRLVSTIPQLHSRMRRPVPVRQVGAADVSAIAGTVGVDNRAAIAALYEVGRRKGGLRAVALVLDSPAGWPATGRSPRRTSEQRSRR